jgi:site-specific recombinase XerD
LGRNKSSGWVRKGSGVDLFNKRFGKTIEEYASFAKATELLKPKTLKTYRKGLPFYFLFLDQDPDSVIAQRKLDLMSLDDGERYEKKTIAYVKSLEAKGMSGHGISSRLSRVQGFYANNGKRLALDLHKLKISKARKNVKYSPSNEDVRLIFGGADSARDRLIVALMYQNGPAPMDMSLLKCGDLPREPWVYFERNRSKTGEVWRGITTPDVCVCLNKYLAVRGNFSDDDPLFVGREGPFNSEAISQVMRELIEKTPLRDVAGFKPTSLRDAFEDALVDAEIYHKIKEALMAHNSGIEKEYGGQNKMVAKLTEAMKKVYPLISLTDDYRESASLPSGFSEEDIAGIKMLLANLDGFLEMARLAKEKKLYHIDDPALIKRLKDEGKI